MRSFMRSLSVFMSSLQGYDVCDSGAVTPSHGNGLWTASVNRCFSGSATALSPGYFSISVLDSTVTPVTTVYTGSVYSIQLSSSLSSDLFKGFVLGAFAGISPVSFASPMIGNLSVPSAASSQARMMTGCGGVTQTSSAALANTTLTWTAPATVTSPNVTFWATVTVFQFGCNLKVQSSVALAPLPAAATSPTSSAVNNTPSSSSCSTSMQLSNSVQGCLTCAGMSTSQTTCVLACSGNRCNLGAGDYRTRRLLHSELVMPSGLTVTQHASLRVLGSSGGSGGGGGGGSRGGGGGGGGGYYYPATYDDSGGGAGPPCTCTCVAATAGNAGLTPPTCRAIYTRYVTQAVCYTLGVFGLVMLVLSTQLCRGCGIRMLSCYRIMLHRCARSPGAAAWYSINCGHSMNFLITWRPDTKFCDICGVDWLSRTYNCKMCDFDICLHCASIYKHELQLHGSPPPCEVPRCCCSRSAASVQALSDQHMPHERSTGVTSNPMRTTPNGAPRPPSRTLAQQVILWVVFLLLEPLQLLKLLGSRSLANPCTRGFCVCCNALALTCLAASMAMLISFFVKGPTYLPA